ncbi:MAG: DUF421 domain-containing protein [Clostridia bacterium]|nr:DUF421 domain-containing protein [Clostridia bacterium]
MTTIFLRILIIYLVLVLAMRIMGKRQIGELEVSELITTLMLSELATGPIENREIPVTYAIVPIITLLTLEVVNSMLLIKIPRIKNLLSSKPSILILRGEMNQRELARIRMSIDELIGELRRQGIASVDEVEYAILEQNGKLTTIPKMRCRQPTLEQLGISAVESGIAHILIADGYVNRFNLNGTGHDDAWLVREVKRRGCGVKDVFLMTVDDAEQIFLIKKEKKVR